jgi:hypothetical protein
VPSHGGRLELRGLVFCDQREQAGRLDERQRLELRRESDRDRVVTALARLCELRREMALERQERMFG